MPEGLDPDDVVKQGAPAYQKCLDDAMPLIDYKLHAIERKFDLSRTDDKRAYVAEALKVVDSAESESVKEELLKKLRDKTGISYHALERDLKSVSVAKPQETATPIKEQITETAADTDKNVKALRFILAAKLFSAPYANGCDLQELSLTDETHIVIAQYVIEREKAGQKIRPGELFEVLSEDSPELNAILDLNYEDKLTGSVAQRFFEDSLRALQVERVEKDISRLNKAYGEATDESDRKGIAQQIAELMKKRSMLKKKGK
jgi:DNA primase